MSEKLIVKYLDPNTGNYENATVADIGDLSKLKTSIRTNLVDAINTIQSGGGNLPDGVQEQLDDINDKLSGLETSGLNNEQKIEQAVKDLNTDIEKVQQDYNAASEIINKISEDTLKQMTSIEDDYNEKVNKITEDLGLAKNEITNTKSDLEKAKSDLNSINSSYVDVTQEVDKLNGIISQKVDSADFDEVESRIEHNETAITQTKKDILLKASQESLDYSNERIEKAEAEIAINKDAITQKVSHEQMQEEVEKIGTYGKNYLMNTRDWYQWNPNDALRVYPTSDKHDHTDILIVEAKGYYMSRVVDDALEIGTTYTASIAVKTDKDDDFAEVSFYEGSSNAYKMKDIYEDTSVDSSWKRIFVSFVATSEKPTVSFRFTNMTPGIQGMMTGAKVEKGNKATAWEANANDDNNAIVKANSEIKQTAGRITSAVSRISETENELDKTKKNLVSTNTRIDQTDEKIALQATKITEIDGKVTENEASLVVANNSIKSKVSQTEVDESISNINIDNKNRVLNSDFSLDFDNWESIDSKFKLVDVDGVKYASISRSGLTAESIASMSSSKFPVKDGQRLMIGFDIIIDNLNNYDVKKPIILELYNIDDVRIDMKAFSLSELKGSLSNGVVGRLNTIYKVNREDVAKGRLRLSLNKNGSVKYTRIMLQAGDLDSTDWSAAPEDSQLIRAKLETSIDQTAQAIKLTATKADLDKTNEQVRLQEGTLEVQSGKIEGVVKDVSASSSKISALTQTASGLTSTVGELSTDNNTNKENISQLKQDAKTFAVTVGEKYSTKDDVNKKDAAQAEKLSQLQLDLNGFKTTVVDNYPDNTKMASQIKQSAEEITGTVSKQYQPKGDYATTGYVASQVEQKADSITSTISTNMSQKYSTKAETETKVSDLKTDLSKLGQYIRYAWSEDGKDRFTKVKQTPNLLLETSPTSIKTLNSESFFRFNDGWPSTNSKLEILNHSFYSNPVYVLKNPASTESFMVSKRVRVKPNTKYFLSFQGFNNGNIKDVDLYFLGSNAEVSDKRSTSYNTAHKVSSKKLSTSGLDRMSGSFTTTDKEVEGYVRIDNNGTSNSDAATLYMTNIMLVEDNGDQSYRKSLDEDYDNIVPRYIGHGIKNSDSSSDYTWSINPERRPSLGYAQSDDGLDFSNTPYKENLLVGTGFATRDGIFRNFDTIKDDYAEVTMTSNNSYAQVGLSNGFSLKPNQYNPGDKIAISYDLMITKWDVPSEADITELAMGQRWMSEANWASVNYHNIPRYGYTGVELNKWIKVEIVTTVPAKSSNENSYQEIIQFRSNNASSIITFRIKLKSFKMELNDRPTPWLPSQKDLSLKDSIFKLSDTKPKYIGTAALPYNDYGKYEWKLNPDWLSVNTQTLVTDQYSQSVQDLEGFKDSVGKTYQSKDAMTGYYNKTQVDSQITQSEGRITSDVKNSYTPQSAFNDLKETVAWNTLNSSQDLNKMTKTGKYLIRASNNTNAPTTGWFYLIVDAPSSDRITQNVQYDASSNNTWVRVYNGSWSTWNKLAGTEYVNSQIDQKAGEITASVQKYADDKSNSAKNDAVNSSKTYTDGQIKITNQAITSTVSNLTTSGGNLFSDSKGVDNWSMASVSSTTQNQIDEPTSPYGKAKHIQMPTGGGGPHKVPYATIVGETYSFSVFIKANTSGTLTLGSEKGGTINAAVTTGWKRFTHTFVAQDTQHGSFVFYRQSNANNITDLYIHSPTFVQGSIIPNWSESVGDTALKSEIKQTATDVTIAVKGYADGKADDAKNAAIGSAKSYTDTQIQISEKGIKSSVDTTYTKKSDFETTGSSSSLINNGDFLKGSIYWDLPSTAQFLNSSQGKGKVLKVFNSSDGAVRSSIYKPKVSLLKNRTYRVLVDVFVSGDYNGPGGNSKFRIGNRTGGGNSPIGDLSYPSARDQWVTISKDFKFGSDYSECELSFQYGGTAGAISIGSVLMYDVTDAVENSNQIETVDRRLTTVDQKADSITSTVLNLGKSENLVAQSYFDDGVNNTWGRNGSASIYTESSSSNIAKRNKMLKFTTRDTYEENNFFYVNSGEILYMESYLSGYYSNHQVRFGVCMTKEDGSITWQTPLSVEAKESMKLRTGQVTVPDGYIKARPFLQLNGTSNFGYGIAVGMKITKTASYSQIKQSEKDITLNVKGYTDSKISDVKSYTDSQITLSEKGITSTVSKNYTTKDEFSKALVYKGDLTGSQSADNLEEGWYNVSSWNGVGGTSWGKMQVYNSGGGHKSQVYVAGGGNTYTRAYQGSPASWSSWQKSTDTKTIISTINQSPESISISASKINLKGAVTIEALATDAKDKLNGAADQINKWRKPNTTKIDGGNIYADSLSVISSDIGTVNAGTINGVKITSTANDNSRIELNGGNFRAYSADGSWTEHTTNGLKNYAAKGNSGTNNKAYGFDMSFTSQGMSISPWGQNENLARNVGIDLYGDNTYMDFHNAKYGNNVDNAGRLWMKDNSVFELTSSVGDLVVTASSNTQVIARNGSVNLQGKSVNVRNSTNTGYVTIYAATFSQQSTHSSKTNFKDIDTNTLLEAVEGTDIVQYQFKDQVANGNPEDMIGFVINDDKKSPYNTTDLIVNKNGTGFDTTTAVGILMGAIKELSKRNKKLEAKIDTFNTLMGSIDLEKIQKTQ